MVRGLVVVVEGIIVFVVVIVVVWLFGGLGGIVLRLRLVLLFPLFDCCGDIGIQAIPDVYCK